ncbi:rho GTPase-activating protein 26-like isoform X4 [Chiloscyllium plagiosum]|uniref:rho GTPase-activating protein 26-like isoform X4 n=1 Tax=Chiloscyllium plagiosum TaxID=36176 RepID=UPI001CB8386C|nr:rho GTPase-activating protein 26-like isoform X4 [Chiloscyllium plagiosum]
MGLPALEFSDCYLDSPQFRDRIKSHEAELEKTNKFIKDLIKDGKALIQAMKNLSVAKKKFAESLNEFKFQCIGDAETDDEIHIARSLQEFAGVLRSLEDERGRLIENAGDVLISPLERFRKEQIGAAKADSQVDVVRQHFYEVSLEYVFRVHEVQERKMFEFVEPLLAFLQGLFTFYHHGYELAKDFGHFKTPLQISIQNTRDRFEGTRSEVESLMKKMKANPQEHQSISPYTMEGYLFVQKKSPFGSSWVKHYCTYQKEAKKVTMVPFDQKTGGKIGDEETFTLKSCIRRKTDSIEKRFCFDVEGVDRATTITMQALSEEDRRLWIEAMDGREPVYNLNKDNPISEGAAQLDKVGFDLVKKCIRAVEERGINEQGLYRIAGVNSRVQKLLGLLMGSVDVDLETSTEWEIKTITSTLKHYLRVLPAPLMTFQLQHSFIKAAKLDHPESRLSEIHKYVHRLPEKNRAMLEITIKHLAKVSKNHKQNLMTVANLGVVFGPTLLRPKEETVAAIMDIKFQNIVVEILIENHEQIFQIVPETATIQPNVTLSSAQRKSFECKPPLCSQRPLMLFPENSNENEKQKNITNSSTESVVIAAVNASLNAKTHRQSVHSLGSCDTETSTVKLERPNSLLNSKRKPNLTSPLPPSPSSPLSPSWPMVSAPSSPVPVSSTSSDSSPLSIQCRKARALYACKAEYDSELSFSAGTMFENVVCFAVHSSKEPGWLEGTLDGKTGLIPENYVEFL